MKKLTTIIIFFVFSILFLHSENQSFLFAKILEKEFCNNLEIIEGTDYKKGDREIFKEAVSSKKLVLRYGKRTYEELFELVKYDYLSAGVKINSITKFFDDLRKGKKIATYFADEIYDQVIDNNYYLCKVSLFSWHDRMTANPIGYYRIAIFFDNNEYDFILIDPYIYIENDKKELYIKTLSDYIEVKNLHDGSAFDSLETSSIQPCWKNQKSMDLFFNDLRMKKNTLPDYVLNFQQTYEELLSAIIECFNEQS